MDAESTFSNPMQKNIRSLVLFILTACCVVVSPDRSSAADSSGALPQEVVVAVKTASLKELSDDIVAVARRVAPGPQVESMPFLLGAMLGDPMLQGLEAGQNIGLALVRMDDDFQPVVFARLTEQSPYRDSLRGYGMEAADHEGWTFATVAPLEPEVLGGLRDRLIEWVRIPRAHDLEVYVNGPKLARLVAEHEDRIRAELRNSGAAEYEEPIWALVQTVAGELRILASAGMGLEFDAEGITQHAHLEADADTALGRFFSADHSASLAPAEWLGTEAPILYVSRANPDALMDYFKYFRAKLEVAGGETMQELMAPLTELMERFTRDTRGHSAGYLNLTEMMPSMVQITDSTADEDGLRAALEASAGLMSHPVFQGMAEGASTELISGEHTVAGLPVFTLTTRMGDEAVAYQGGAFASEAHYVQAGEYLVMADNLETLEAIVTAILAGEKPERNAAQLFDRDSGAASQVRIDGGLLLGYFGAFMAPEREINVTLPPAKGEIHARDNAARWRFEIPTELIAGIYREVQAMSEGMGQEFPVEEQFDLENSNEE